MRLVDSYCTIHDEYNGTPSGVHELALPTDGVSCDGAHFPRLRANGGASHRKEKNPSESAASVWAALAAVFLPQGYPHTVTGDYLQYQIWDTVQAFASSITGALATTAVFKGVGVGSQSASVLAASITWLLKDGTGMVGRIAFVWAKGTALDSDCKKWRLVADVLNDFAFCLDLVGAHLPPACFTSIACTTSLLRSIVGVAGGATRIAIVRHQARRDNLADVVAKDGSQETVVNLVSLLVSLILLPLLDGQVALTWICFAICTTVHLFANYRAVKSLHLDVLNRERLTLCVKSFIDNGDVLPVALCNAKEPIFGSVTKQRFFGCSYSKFHDLTKGLSPEINRHNPNFLCAYVPRKDIGCVVLDIDATKNDMLIAAFNVEFYTIMKKWPNATITHSFHGKLKRTGWHTDSHQLNFDEWRIRCTIDGDDVDEHIKAN